MKIETGTSMLPFSHDVNISCVRGADPKLIPFESAGQGFQITYNLPNIQQLEPPKFGQQWKVIV